jgi:hypothetical protein
MVSQARVSITTKITQLANHEIVALAVYLLGGTTKPVDTEDVAIKANELAPGRFSWTKYRDQINLELIRVYLSDAKKQSKGAYLNGSGNAGWTLTPRGLGFARERAKTLSSSKLARVAIDMKEKRWRRGERTRLLSTTAFAKFAGGHTDEISPAEAAAFFRVDAYVGTDLRKRRVARIVNAFGDDPELGKAVKALSNAVGR